MHLHAFACVQLSVYIHLHVWICLHACICRQWLARSVVSCSFKAAATSGFMTPAIPCQPQTHALDKIRSVYSCVFTLASIPVFLCLCPPLPVCISTFPYILYVYIYSFTARRTSPVAYASATVLICPRVYVYPSLYVCLVMCAAASICSCMHE